MSALELRSVTCCVRSSGGAPRLNFGVFYAGFGHVFRRFGLFLALAPAGIVQRLAAQKWEKSLEELGETCRLSPEDTLGSEYLQ